jgi:hypothetical protein
MASRKSAGLIALGLIVLAHSGVGAGPFSSDAPGGPLPDCQGFTAAGD